MASAIPYPLGIPTIPTAATFVADALPGATDAPPAAAEEGSSLASVAKAAAMKAERAAIEQTLRQVHWNRRKAAQILGVSYKTLLNKIKESGISRA
jgi:DNA-binding NtrC family response regulator